MESVQKILQRLLDERYEAGREAGYEQALAELMDVIKGMRSGGVVEMVEGSRVLADHPGDENDAGPEPTENGVGEKHVLPHQMRAYERLKQCPNGITCREARAKWGGSNSVLYQLAKLGLAEKRGAQFYAKDEARA